MKPKYNFLIINKIISAFLILLIMCMLSGCDSSKNDNNNNANKLSSESMPDFQYMFKFEGGYKPTQKSDSGYYNIVNDRIIYTDETTLKSTPLCNKSDCLHTGNYPNCNAVIKNWLLCFNNFQIYKNKIYYMAVEFSETEKKDIYYLNSISLDGSEKNLELTIKNNYVLDWFIYNGYFYYHPSIDIGNDNTKSGNFYKIDLSSKSEDVFIDFTAIPNIFGAEGFFRNIYKNYMYLTLTGYANEDAYNKIVNGETLEDNSDVIREIVRYNLYDGSYTIINPYNNEYEFVGFYNGKLLGYANNADDDNNNVCISELDGTNPKTIITFKPGSQVYCDNDYIYVYNQSAITDTSKSDEPKTITVYDGDGKKLSEVYVPDEISDSLLTTTFYDKYIWFIDNSNSGNDSLCVIDKTELLNNGKEITYKEVYSYE